MTICDRKAHINVSLVKNLSFQVIFNGLVFWLCISPNKFTHLEAKNKKKKINQKIKKKTGGGAIIGTNTVYFMAKICYFICKY